MEQKPMVQPGSLAKRTLHQARQGLQVLPIAVVLFLLSASAAQAEIVDRFNDLGADVESWANILIPTIIVFAFIGVIYFVVTSNPKWRGALAVFIVALMIWGGLDEIVAWSHKIGGGDGTVNLVGGGSGNGGGVN